MTRLLQYRLRYACDLDYEVHPWNDPEHIQKVRKSNITNFYEKGQCTSQNFLSLLCRKIDNIQKKHVDLALRWHACITGMKFPGSSLLLMIMRIPGFTTNWRALLSVWVMQKTVLGSLHNLRNWWVSQDSTLSGLCVAIARVPVLGSLIRLTALGPPEPSLVHICNDIIIFYLSDN